MKLQMSLVLALAIASAGCAEPTTAAQDTRNSFAKEFKRDKERAGNQNQLRQIALFYNHFFIDHGRAPANEKEFILYIEKEAKPEVRALKNKVYVMIWKVHNPGSTTVVAYEKEADHRDKHLVAMGDGTVHQVKSQDLPDILKGTKSP